MEPQFESQIDSAKVGKIARNSRSDKWGFCYLYETDLSYYERQLISAKRSYLIVIKFVLLSLIKSVHYQT